MAVVFGLAVILLAFGGCGGGDEPARPTSAVSSTSPRTSVLTDTAGSQTQAVVVARHPHDPTSFTQGLVFSADGRLFESAGGYGTSEIRQVDPATGVVQARRSLDPSLFAEGLTIAGDELVQLTWKEGAVLRWSLELKPGRGSTITGEGWGLATLADGSLISSDGSDLLTVRDPSTMEPRRSVSVTGSDGAPLQQLNELEVVGDRVWANVWHSNEIVRIDPANGRVDAAVDLSSLVPPGLSDPEAVLNGIAHRRGDPPGRLWVTGKLWPTLYEVDLRGIDS